MKKRNPIIEEPLGGPSIHNAQTMCCVVQPPWFSGRIDAGCIRLGFDSRWGPVKPGAVSSMAEREIADLATLPFFLPRGVGQHPRQCVDIATWQPWLPLPNIGIG